MSSASVCLDYNNNYYYYYYYYYYKEFIGRMQHYVTQMTSYLLAQSTYR